MNDFITFGETMLRLSPPGFARLEGAAALNMTIGGSESNVAVNLARLGKRSAWFSRLPDNPLGHTALNLIREHGVDVSQVVWDSEHRMGLYFVEFGQTPRGIQVWYDRQHSAASHMTPADLPLAAIASARWLHCTGITPALSASCHASITAAIAHARQAGVRVSFDVNYRARLWDAPTAAAALAPLCQQADVVFVARRDAVKLWGAPDDAAECAKAMQQAWGGAVIVSDGERGAVITDGTTLAQQPSVPTTIVDRLGAGDALAAGVLCRLLEDAPLEDALRFGLALAALALSVPGDIARVSRAEVEAVLANAVDQLKR
jgi:2-dehydro-3-deoxygluconokinase